MKSLLLTGVTAAALSAVGFAGAAQAADARLPVKAPVIMPAPAPAPAPVSPWSGCYGGAHGGWGSARTSWTDPVPNGAIDVLSTGQTAKTSMSGGLYGGQVGCDFQMGGSLVFGIEGSISGTSLDDTRVDPSHSAWMLGARHDWLAALTGRVGFGAGNALIYGRGGIAWADSKLDIQNNGIFDGDVSKRRQGWVFGGGIEYAFSPTWSMFVEGDYYKFGDTDLAFAGDVINPQPAFTVRSKETIQAVKVGLNYRFGNIFGGGY